MVKILSTMDTSDEAENLRCPKCGSRQVQSFMAMASTLHSDNTITNHKEPIVTCICDDCGQLGMVKDFSSVGSA